MGEANGAFEGGDTGNRVGDGAGASVKHVSGFSLLKLQIPSLIQSRYALTPVYHVVRIRRGCRTCY